jgi:hypothetical protein
MPNKTEVVPAKVRPLLFSTGFLAASSLHPCGILPVFFQHLSCFLSTSILPDSVY